VVNQQEEHREFSPSSSHSILPLSVKTAPTDEHIFRVFASSPSADGHHDQPTFSAYSRAENNEVDENEDGAFDEKAMILEKDPAIFPIETWSKNANKLICG
jgi:hypothetical protein